MKLSELKNDPIRQLLDELEPSHGTLEEGVLDTLSTGFKKIANTFSKVASSSNTKSALNDGVLGKIYQEELGKIKVDITALPEAVQKPIVAMLAKHDIKFTGVDLSRKHINRIAILKVMRFVVFALKQLKDNGIEWVVSAAFTGGITAILSAIWAAKDLKAVAGELSNSAGQAQALFKKANE